MGISLEKKQELVKVVLAKRNVPTDFQLAVKTCIDISGSMMGLFNNGTVQELVDRLIPVAMRFDDNESIEAYAYGSGATKLSDIKPEHFGNYVNTRFLPEAKKSGHLWSGTSYASALNLVLKDSKGGFFSKPKPGYLMFITDGETMDESQSEKLLKELGEKNVYVQLIGVGYSSFGFLKRMGDKYDTVGFVHLKNLEAMTDEQLYNELLSDELADWIRSR